MSAFEGIAANIRNFIHWSQVITVFVALLGGVTATRPLRAQDHTMDDDHAPAKLVAMVQDATRKYFNVNDARKAGYGPFLGCVTGPDHGAMGVHYVNGALLNGELYSDKPQALIYEPVGNRFRLVGVEFIVDAATWLKSHKGAPPVLEGQVLQLVPAPNRFNLPSFFEIHVWAWRHNPNGAFVDWNNRVTCEQGE
jgi:hypothetical protein